MQDDCQVAAMLGTATIKNVSLSDIEFSIFDVNDGILMPLANTGLLNENTLSFSVANLSPDVRFNAQLLKYNLDDTVMPEARENGNRQQFRKEHSAEDYDTLRNKKNTSHGRGCSCGHCGESGMSRSDWKEAKVIKSVKTVKVGQK